MGLEKINELKKIKGLTNKKISEMTGISISSLDKITAGDNVNPKFETIKLICGALGCTLDDLADNDSTPLIKMASNPAEEDMIKKYRALDYFGKKAIDDLLETEYSRCTPEEVEEEPEPMLQIRHCEYKVSAGHGFEFFADEEWDEIAVPDTRETRRADFALTIQGDSMEPVYHDGDIVLVKQQDAVDVGQIGVFVLNAAGYIKKNGGDRLISLNEKYDDILIEEYDDCRCFGKVIGRV